MKKQRKITINVDDLGLSEAVNQAVVELATLKRIHSSSYMVGGHISDAHKFALNHSGIDIGLHLDFTEIFDSPLTRPLKSLLLASYSRQLDSQAVAENIAMQIAKFEAVFKRSPVFVDGHQHAHQFPIIRDALMVYMKEKYGEKVATRVTKPLCNDFKSWVIYALGGRAWRNLCKRENIPSNTHFAGVYGFDADESRLAILWQKWLSNSDENTLIMCHPSVPDSTWNDEIKVAREREYHYLISDKFGELLNLHI